MTKLQCAETSLRALIDTKINDQIVRGLLHGFKLQNIIPDDELTRDRRRITQSVLDCLHVRLENLSGDEIFLSCNAFNKNWPLSTEREALLQYGIGDIRQIFKHYETVLTNAGCN